jgi:hypothetical protein
MKDKTVKDELDEYFTEVRAIKIHHCPLCHIECFEEDIQACEKENIPLVCTNCIPKLKEQMALCLPLLSTIRF